MSEHKINKTNPQIILVIGIIALLAIGFLSASVLLDKKADTINVFSDQLPDKQTLSSSGTVVKYVSPDKVEISLSIETLSNSAQKSQADNAAIADEVISALKQAGISSSEIKTISFSVYEEFSWNDFLKKSESKGYKTINTIMVTLSDTTKAGQVVDVAIDAGANRIDSISFGLTESKEMEIRMIALKEASETAKQKAQSIASGLNLSLKNVISVNESSFYYTPNYKSYDSLGVAEEVRASTPITAGDVQVSASVSVVFEVQ